MTAGFQGILYDMWRQVSPHVEREFSNHTLAKEKIQAIVQIRFGSASEAARALETTRHSLAKQLKPDTDPRNSQVLKQIDEKIAYLAQLVSGEQKPVEKQVAAQPSNPMESKEKQRPKRGKEEMSEGEAEPTGEPKAKIQKLSSAERTELMQQLSQLENTLAAEQEHIEILLDNPEAMNEKEQTKALENATGRMHGLEQAIASLKEKLQK